MKKIAILGGTFDPPHIGHLIIANEIMYELSLDEVWFMPNSDPPHKRKTDGISNENRLNMLQLSIQNEERFRVERIELERPGPSYTYETMKILVEMHEDTQFYFIIGADMIEYLPNWYKIDELVKIITFVGVNRPNYSSDTHYPIELIDIPLIDISSTDIRQRLRNNRPVRYIIHEKVLHYIKENNLYGS